MSIEAKTIVRLSGIAGGRVFPAAAPPGTALPYVIYQMLGGPRFYDFSGPTANPSSRLRITTWARTYGEAVQVTEQIANAMTPLGADLSVGAVFDPVSLFDPTDRSYGLSQDFSVHEH